MSFEDVSKEYFRQGLDVAVGVAGFCLAYTGVSLALNIPVYAGLYGIERLLNLPEREETAVLEELSDIHFLGTRGRVACGQFVTADGRELYICDYPSVQDGKLFANTMLEHMQEGGRYQFTVRGADWYGYTITDVLQEEW